MNEILQRARAILADPDQVVENHRKPSSNGRFCAAGALVHAAGNAETFREHIDQDWAVTLVKIFVNEGREAAVRYIDLTGDRQ